MHSSDTNYTTLHYPEEANHKLVFLRAVLEFVRYDCCHADPNHTIN